MRNFFSRWWRWILAILLLILLFSILKSCGFLPASRAAGPVTDEATVVQPPAPDPPKIADPAPVGGGVPQPQPVSIPEPPAVGGVVQQATPVAGGTNVPLRFRTRQECEIEFIYYRSQDPDVPGRCDVLVAGAPAKVPK